MKTSSECRWCGAPNIFERWRIVDGTAFICLSCKASKKQPRKRRGLKPSPSQMLFNFMYSNEKGPLAESKQVGPKGI